MEYPLGIAAGRFGREYCMQRGTTDESGLTLASPSNVTIAFKAGSNIVQVLEDPSVVTVVQRC